MIFARKAVRCVCSGWLVGALVSGALVAGVGESGAAEAAAGFLPHRAVYDLSLAKSRSNGSVTGAAGKLSRNIAPPVRGSVHSRPPWHG